MPCKFGEDGTVSVGGAGGTVTAPDPGSGGPDSSGPPPGQGFVLPDIDPFILRHHKKVVVYDDGGTSRYVLPCGPNTDTWVAFVAEWKRYHYADAGKKFILQYFIDTFTGTDQRIIDSWGELIGGNGTPGPFHFKNFIETLPPGFTAGSGTPFSVTYVSPVTNLQWDIPIEDIGRAAEFGEQQVFLFPGFEQVPGNPVVPTGFRDPVDVPKDFNLQVLFSNFTPTLEQYKALKCIICGEMCETVNVTTIDQEDIIPTGLTPADNSGVTNADVQTAPPTDPAADVATPEQPTTDPREIAKRFEVNNSGQLLTVVPEGLRGRYNENSILSSVNVALMGISDPIRRALRTFWLEDTEPTLDLRILRWSGDASFVDSKEFSGFERVSVEMREGWSDPITPNLNTSLPVFYEQFVATANEDSNRFKTGGQFDLVKWKNFVDSFVLAEPDTSDRFNDLTRNLAIDRVYDDLTFDTPLPYDRDRFPAENQIPNGVWADITSEYNYYIESYEGVLDDRSVKEFALPNWYDHVINDYVRPRILGGMPAPEPSPALTFGGVIPTVDIPQLPQNPLPANSSTLTLNPLKKPLVGSNEISDTMAAFYDLYSGLVFDPEIGAALADAANSFQQKDVIVRSDAMKLFNDNFGRRFAFPMHVDIELKDNPARNIVELFDNVGGEKNFHNYAINQTYNPSKEISYERPFYVYRTNLTNNNSFERTKDDLQTIDLTFWIENQLTQGRESLDDDIEETAEVYELDTGPGIDGQLEAVLLKSGIVDVLRNNMRSMANVLNGEKAQAETLLYRVTKHEVDIDLEPIEEPIQTFWLPSSDRYEAIRFADNQVKYGKDYIYVIRVFRLVYGTRYQYVNVAPVNMQPESKRMLFATIAAPRLTLVEVPLHSEAILVLDRPPMMPQVDLSGYKGVDNEILVRLAPSVGRALLVPELGFSEDDETRFRRSQQLPESDNRIWFESDDLISGYEVYYSPERPRFYTDFSLFRTVDNDLGSSLNIDVRPNRKYYFLFVAIDVHGHRSNPTEIHEVSVINDDGAVYLDHEVVPLREPENLSFEREGRRFVAVTPKPEQVILNEEAMGITQDTESYSGIKPKLGIVPENQSIFERTFRMRVESKHTGKKFDVIFTYSLIDQDES